MGRASAIALVVALSGSQVAAQEWREAYSTGDFRRAAALIQQLLLDVVAFGSAPPEAAAFEALADMYATGRGVETDPTLACAIMDHAARAALSVDAVRAVRSALPGHEVAAALRYEAESTRLDSRRAQLCRRLSADDRAEALRLLGCPTAPFPRHFYDLGEGRSIEIDRRGVRMHHAGGEWFQQHTGCPLAFELVRYTRVELPSGAAPPARHVVELFRWDATLTDSGARMLSLQWWAFEIVGQGLRWRARQTVGFAPSLWPPPSALVQHTTVDFTIDAAGDLRWRFSASGGPSGMFEREFRP